MKKAHVILTSEDLATIDELLSKGNLAVRKQNRAIGLRESSFLLPFGTLNIQSELQSSLKENG